MEESTSFVTARSYLESNQVNKLVMFVRLWKEEEFKLGRCVFPIRQVRLCQ